MASKRYVPGVDGAKGTYLPCPNCGKKVCECLELRLLAQIEAHGLPVPIREFVFAPPRKWKADLAYPQQKIIIEIEGGGGVGRHTSAVGFREDCVKYNVISTLGYKLIRTDGNLIKNGEAVKFVIAALQGKVYIPERSTRGTRRGRRGSQQDHKATPGTPGKTQRKRSGEKSENRPKTLRNAGNA